MKLLLFLAVLVTAVAADAVTDELEKNGLPVGLLPGSISTYSIDKDGQLALSLKAPCYAKIDDQLAYYSQNITGKLKYGSISSLEGIQTKNFSMFSSSSRCRGGKLYPMVLWAQGSGSCNLIGCERLDLPTDMSYLCFICMYRFV